VASIAERVSNLEGQVQTQERRIDDVRDAIMSLERRIDARFDAVDRRLSGVEDKMTRHFVWLVGIVVTAMVGIVTALAGR
jgi:hypothetical protein